LPSVGLGIPEVMMPTCFEGSEAEKILWPSVGKAKVVSDDALCVLVEQGVTKIGKE
jgi:hypothetical protein